MADQTFAVHCGFFDAINSDRTYSADEMNRPYKRVISNGVFATPNGTPSTDLQVTASSGMNIICKKGEGLFGDKWFENPSGIAITVPSNTGTVPRIDSVIVQVDTRTSGRVGNIVHRTGTPASSPVPPAINQVEGVIEYRLANIRVNAGVSAITQSMITDRRGSSDCPWVTSLIYQVDTSTLYDQWQAAYAEYFEEEKAIWDAWYAQLTEDLDVSMTLDRHTNTVTTTERTFDVSIGLDYNHNTDILEVYINGLRAVEGTQYNVNDDTSISLINPVSSGQDITFVVLKSVISGSATTIMTILQTLEEKIAGIAGGTPTVVDSTSDMTDTEKIYVLSTDGKWYYYSATQEDWVIGGIYGGVPTDPTLTQEGMAADAKAVGDALANVDVEVDTTLTQAGKAADAKAVGDAIDSVEEDISDITDSELVYNGSVSSSDMTRIEDKSYNQYHAVIDHANFSILYFTAPVTAHYNITLSLNSQYRGYVYSALPMSGSTYVKDVGTPVNLVVEVDLTAGQICGVSQWSKVFTMDVVYSTTTKQVLKSTIGLTSAMLSETKALIGMPWEYAIDHVLCIGDSLTYGSPADSSTMPYPISQNYPYYLGRMLGLTGDITNGGMPNYGAKTYYHNKFGDFTLSNYNTFIIFLGTNSGLTDTLDTDVDPYSDYHDFADTDTGCYCAMIEAIYEAKPNAIIILVNTWHIAIVQPDTRITIRKIGEKYSLPVVETYDIMRYGVNPAYHGGVDNVHCSKAGYLALANLIREEIYDYMSSDVSRANKGMS